MKIAFLLLLLIIVDIVGFTVFANLISQKSDISVAAAIIMSFGFMFGNIVFFTHLGRYFNVEKN
jgi:hypothetical protein